jgi:pimeloyl-ACP methyl ester carboxylesterase
MNKQSVKWLDESGFHSLAYYEWGDSSNQNVIICAHGLTRNGRDFDYLAQRLQKDYRVICPDFPGRGESDWLEIKSNYDYSYYLQAFSTLIARLNCQQLTWLGTSMGGMTGMLMAATPNNPINRLILNDIGPYIPAEAISAIAKYVGKQTEFSSIKALKEYLKGIHSGFGELTDAEWQHLADHSYRTLKNGHLALAYDPEIIRPFKAQVDKGVDISLWSIWHAVSCPVLILRGLESPLLSRATADRMCQHRETTLIEIANTGHAPALMAAEQIELIYNWLKVTPTITPT